MSSPDRKRASSSPTAAVVSPEKPAKQPRIEEYDDDEQGVTATSVMGFSRLPDVTNGDIMTKHYGFVCWAKEMKAVGAISGRLADFMSWVDSPEGHRLEAEREREDEGKEKFGFGKHKGKTFKEIAQDDPAYHERYMTMLRKKGEGPNAVLSRYISWFEKSVGRRVKSSSTVSRTRVKASDNDGNVKFNFGKHRGHTFRQVATEDPSYHLRCEATGYCPKGGEDVMQSYIEYFGRHGDHDAASQGEMDAIESAALGMFGCPYQYDDDE